MWSVDFSTEAKKQFYKLDRQIQQRIKDAVIEKLAKNPEHHLVPLTANLNGLYKFRVGDYRLICQKEKGVFIILVLKLKHRKEVYDI